MGDLVLALPLYRSIPVEWFCNFVDIDKTRCAGIVRTESAPLLEAMTALIQGALDRFGDKEWDRLVVWEQDMIVPIDALNQIADYPCESDIVGSLYFQHHPPHVPMAWMQVKPHVFTQVSRSSIQQMVNRPDIYPVDSVGFGFISIGRHVLEHWDTSIPMFYAGQISVGAGHDIWFCTRAKEQGFTVGVDSGLICGHLSQLAVGLADHQRYPIDGGASLDD